MGATVYEGASESPFDVPDAQPPIAASLPPDDAGDFEGLGRLLEMAQDDPDKCAKEMVKEWERQDPAMTRRKVFWDMYTLMLRGVRGVRAMYPTRQDLYQVRLYVPLGALDNISPLDRTDELCERVTAHLLSDPPTPDPEPASDSDDDRDAAEFSKRVLLAEAGEAGCNYQAKFRRGHKKAAVFGSSFLYIWTDPTGGGKQEPLAPDPAIVGSGAPAGYQGNQPPQNASVPRGTLPETGAATDQASAPSPAQPGWKPKLMIDVLSGLNVRFLPEQCDGIGTAEGAMILRCRTLGQLRDEFPELRPNDENFVGNDVLMSMANWRNVAMLWVMPWFAKMGYTTQPIFDEDGTPADSTLIGLLAMYQKAAPSYPKGAYLLTAGDAYLLHAGTWSMEYPKPDGTMCEEPLDIPLAQIRQFDDTDGDDPYGYGLIRKVGPADEVRGTVVLAMLDHMDRFGHPNTWVGLGSPVQPEDFSQRMGIPLPYIQSAGAPIQEEIPPFDPASAGFFQLATAFQDSTCGLGETAQGTELPEVTSGKQASIIIGQKIINLSTQAQNLGDACQRTWRLMLEQIRAFWTVPQRMQFTTEDGDYAEREWSRTDLASTKNVRIGIGSFTQQTPEAKIQTAISYSQVPGLVDDPEDLQRIVADSINPILGMKDKPSVQRIRGQIAVWKQGPPPGWLDAAQQAQIAQQNAMQQATAEVGQQAQVAAQQAAMQPPPPLQTVAAPGTPQQPAEPAQPPSPQEVQQKTQQRAMQLMQQSGVQPPPGPFTRSPSDLEQKVAIFRHRELTRLTQSKAFDKQPPPWQALVASEYNAMRQAAGVMLVSEQAQMQQGQAQLHAQTEGQIEVSAAQARATAQGQLDGQSRTEAAAIDAGALKQEHEYKMEEIVLERALAPAPAPPDLTRDAADTSERVLAGA